MKLSRPKAAETSQSARFRVISIGSELADFLEERSSPAQQALLRLIGTLVEVPPYAEDPNGETDEPRRL